jgi:hypothetical protein
VTAPPNPLSFARRGIDAVIERFDIAMTGETLFAGEAHFHLSPAFRIRGQLVCPTERGEAEVGVLVHIAIDMHRVDRDHGGQQGGKAVRSRNVVSQGNQSPADPAIDGRTHVAKIQIQLGGVACRLCGELGRAGIAGLPDAGIRLLRADGMGRQQLFATLGFAFGNFQLSGGAFQIGLSQLERRLAVAGIDYEKHVAFVDQLPGLEFNLLEVAGNSGPNLDDVHGIQTPCVLIVFRDFGRHS